MDPITTTLILSITTLIVGVALLVKQKKIEKSQIIIRARERANKRVEDRAFCDTIPMNDPYRTGIEYSVEVIEDNFIPSTFLSAEQMRTIGLICDDLRVREKHHA